MIFHSACCFQHACFPLLVVPMVYISQILGCTQWFLIQNHECCCHYMRFQKYVEYLRGQDSIENMATIKYKGFLETFHLSHDLACSYVQKIVGGFFSIPSTNIASRSLFRMETTDFSLSLSAVFFRCFLWIFSQNSPVYFNWLLVICGQVQYIWFT